MQLTRSAQILLRVVAGICIVAASFWFTLVGIDYLSGDGFSKLSGEFTTVEDIAAMKIPFANSSSSSFSGVNVDVGTYNGQPVLFAGRQPPQGALAFALASLGSGKIPTPLPAGTAYCGVNPDLAVTGKIQISTAENCSTKNGEDLIHPLNGCPAYDMPGHPISLVFLCENGVTTLVTSAGPAPYDSSLKAGRFATRVAGIGDYDGDGQPDVWVIWPDRLLACLLTYADAKAHANVKPNAGLLPGVCAATITIPRSYMTNSGSAGDFSVGWSLYAADYDKDGKPDFVLGAPHAFDGRGAVFIVPGAMIAQAIKSKSNISVDAPGVVRLSAKHSGSWLGSLLFSAARDVTGNGTADLVLAEQNYKDSGSGYGAILVVDGSTIADLMKKAAR